MKPRSFFVSLLLGNLLLTGVILGLGAWWTYLEMNRQSDRNSRRFQGQLLSMVQEGVEESWPDADHVIEQYCRSYSGRPEFRLTVVDTNGRVLGDSEYPADRMKLHNDEDHPEIIDALSGKSSESIRYSQTKKTRYRYIAAPISHNNKIVGVVRVAFPLSDLLEDRRRLLSGITTCFFLMLLAAVVFTIFLSRLWSKPLKIISHTAWEISQGHTIMVPYISGSLEMIELRDAINTMQRTVSRQLETITSQRERLQSVLQHLPDAVFALNSRDQIVYYNESAESLFHLEPSTVADFIQHVIRFPNILDFYFEQREMLLRHEVVRPTALEIKLGQRKQIVEVKLIDAMSHRDDGGITSLLIVNDLTDTIQTERMKTDFVANTSHELRTPLTTIRMTLDNALDGIYPASSHQDVFEMLDRGVKRLESLTDDLLALHSVEDMSTPNRLETTTLEEQKQWIEEFFQRPADEKNIDFSIELPEQKFLPFSIDTKRLGLVLQNLVDNALKFTVSEGKVCIRFSIKNDDSLLIQCEDNGCGVSIEDQNRVFERFYRVKQKNGNQQSGTGLGLSIVKHAVERLGGSVTLSSQYGVGSVFTVCVPIIFSET